MKNARARFAICIDNEGTPASLETGKVYRVLRTEKTARNMGLIRVVDDSGEDYLYKADQFVDIEVPRSAQHVVTRAR